LASGEQSLAEIGRTDKSATSKLAGSKRSMKRCEGRGLKNRVKDLAWSQHYSHDACPETILPPNIVHTTLAPLSSATGTVSTSRRLDRWREKLSS
jgi:hypothetical protein